MSVNDDIADAISLSLESYSKVLYHYTITISIPI